MDVQLLHPLRLQQPTGEHAVCTMCRRYCALRPGQAGFCRAVINRGGALYSTIYGLIAEYGVDPIEKKPVRCYRPGTKVLTIGSFGCNLRCDWCQNWEIAFVDASTPIKRRRYTPGEVVAIALRAGCAGIAWSYNEPGIWVDFIADCAALAHDAGLYTVLVTNGLLAQESIAMLDGLIDVYRADFKCLDDTLLRWHAHLPSSDLILESIRMMHLTGAHVELVTVVMPQFIEGDHLKDMAAWVCAELGPATPWHLTRFVPYARLSDLPPTSVTALDKAGAIATSGGMRRVFVGDWYEAVAYTLGCLL